MVLTLEEVCAEVLKRTIPNNDERKHVLELAKKLTKRVKAAAEEAGIEAEVRVEGSVAKDTWLKEEPDIDIFMQVPVTMLREAFGKICLKIAKKATEGHKQIERFAEHPYLESFINKTRVNIVPCYQVKKGEWISATDRTPFHTDYVKSLLNSRLRSQVRLLKRFMKGIDVYGAEIRVGGFSGYLCELLILHHGSITEFLRSIADWRESRVIDYEGHYKGREQDARKIFEEPLVVVDPVDKGRNAAAAVTKERLNELVVASRAFLENPGLEFFYPQETEAYTPEELVQAITTRRSTIVFVKFGNVRAVPDILWGQLYKSQRSLRKMLQQHNFSIIRDHVWSNEQDLNMFIFEVKQRFLPLTKKHLGPPIEKRKECEKFLRKHVGATTTVSGPHVEDGRWVVETKRRHMDIVNLLVEKLNDGGRRVGVASLVSQSLANTLKMLVNEEIMKLYLSNSEFAKFLTEYLEGKPKWLSGTDEKN
ncbi:MAG: CCA tRNA nucleotidyltransferase [Candidatus Bathyarchaeota archaeon]|nr:MAG: CCA tRNA nucleotidyltransferase [Candidatus Bathyarchaeota archaeon]